MEFKIVETKGIQFIDNVPGSDRWFWGMDYTSGDLYEAEELFDDGHEIRKNRLVLVSYPEGIVREPVIAAVGQYLGSPVFTEGRVFLLLVDFNDRRIKIMRCSEDCAEAEVYAEIPLDEAKDCYNLMLHIEPLTLTRQGHEDRFQVIWPDKGDFEMDPRESLDSRQGDVLIFGKWFEDPDYREVTVIRRYPTGEVLETMDGSVRRMSDGELWVLR